MNTLISIFVNIYILWGGGWGGQGSKTADRIGKGISKEVNFMEYWQYALGKYLPNL